MRKFCLALLSLAAVTAAANPVWPQNLKLRSSVSLEWTQACVALPDGSLLLVWSDTHAIDRDIYAQRVSAAGDLLWPEPRVVDNKSGFQKNPVLAASSDGLFFVAWNDTHANIGGDLRIQKIDSAGQCLWAEGGIPVTASDANEYELRLTPDSGGGVIVTWVRESDGEIYSYGQKFAADGTRLWAEGGINLTGQNYYTLSSIQSDGAGGIYCAYSSDYIAESYVYLNRISSAGTPLWLAPACLGDGVNTFRRGLVLLCGNALYLTCYGYTGSGDAQFLQQYDLNGNPAWPQPLDITPAGQYLGIPLHFVYSPSDNSFLLSHIVYGADNQNSLFLRKFDASGQALWSVPVEPNLAYFYEPRTVDLIADGSGGGYLAYSRANPDYWYGDPCLQRFDINGAPQWGNGVQLMGNPGSWPLSSLHAHQGALWIAWTASAGENYGLHYQKLTPEGTIQLEPGGRELFSGLKSMWTEGWMVVPRSTDHLVLWNDDRYSDNMCHVYFQAVNPNGTMDYTPNGVPVTCLTGAEQYLATAVVLPDDRTVVVWFDRRTGYYELYAQLLDAQGTRLWAQDGVHLRGIINDGWIPSLKICEENGSVFFVWSYSIYSGSGNTSLLQAQKITNGVAQWGENGIDLLPAGDYPYKRLVDLKGRCLLYSGRMASSGVYTQVFAHKFSAADASPEPGWSAFGTPICQDGAVGVYSRQGIALQPRPEGMFALYSEASDELGNCVMAQLLGPNGALLLAPTGELVLDVPGYVSPQYADLGTNDFAVLWQQHDNGYTGSYLQRFLYAPAPLWDAVAIPDSIGYLYSRPARLDNDAFLVSWAHNPDYPYSDLNAWINYIYVTPEGSLYGPDHLYTIPTGDRVIYSLQASALGNQTLLLWADGSSYNIWKDEPIEHCNLWVRMVGNPTTAADDPGLVPGAPAALLPNRPNPFASGTTLRYALKAPGAIELAVYNLRGQLVRVLERVKRTAGEHTAHWDGTDAQGRAVASGIYLCRLSSGGTTSTRRLLLLK